MAQYDTESHNHNENVLRSSAEHDVAGWKSGASIAIEEASAGAETDESSASGSGWGSVRTPVASAETGWIVPGRSGSDASRASGDSREAIAADAGETQTATQFSPATDPVQPVRVFIKPVVRGGDRYEIQGLLGHGGMGSVYKAFDRNLKRTVALKFIRNADERLARRFLQEAQAQARVDHEHVCKVHEVGAVDGHLYISMQYIEGRTLKDSHRDMMIEEKVKVLTQVAWGLHAAHRLGLVHRDIKPSNIMVSRDGEGRPRPYLMDFGLARDTESGGDTMAGSIVGTPAYMAPEQAAGEHHDLDRRTDVYSLGATMYELFTSHAPFEGGGAATLLVKVMTEEPRQMRELDQRIPADLNTIVMKCLEKDPTRRYESARALAEDLQRYLDGEPLVAKSASLAYRAGKRIRKHMALFTVSVLASVIVLALAAMWARSRWNARAEAELAHRLGLEVASIESELRFAHLSRRHEIRQEVDAARAHMQRLRSMLVGAGAAGRGPGHYALGLAHMAFREYEEAHVQLKLSWDAGYRAPAVALSFGQTLGELYSQRISKARSIRDRAARERAEAAVRAGYLNPALEFLDRGAGARPDQIHWVQALIAFYQQDYDRALTRARASRANAAWFYDALLLEGRISHTLGTEARDRGEYERAHVLFSQARASYEEALKIAESDPLVYQRLCEVDLNQMVMENYQSGRDLKQDRDRVIDTAGLGLQIDPEDPALHTAIAEASFRYGENSVKAGRFPDAAAAFDAAVASAAQAVSYQKREENRDSAYAVQGMAHAMRAFIQAESGEDPRERQKMAAAAFESAIAANPTIEAAHNGLGIVYRDIAEWNMNHGSDPVPYFDKSIRTLVNAIESFPRSFTFHTNLGTSRSMLAAYGARRGRDPIPGMREALAEFRIASEINPRNTFAPLNAAMAWIEIARWEADTGRDPGASLQQARKQIEAARALDPEFVLSLYLMGAVDLRGAAYEVMLGRDASGPLGEARRWYQDGLSKMPFPDAFVEQGETYVQEARAELRRGRSPLTALDKAQKLIEQARGRTARPAFVLEALTEVKLMRAEWLNGRAADAQRELASAASLIDELQRIDPTDPHAELLDARRWLLQGTADLGSREGVESAISRGIAAASRALQMHPDLAEAHVTRGRLNLLAARTLPGSTEFARAAIECFERALKANANLQTEIEAHVAEARVIAGRA